MSLFARRFTTDPGDDVLLNIESVNILDLAPPSAISGVGTGKVLIVGEFEDGPFGMPTDILNANDLMSLYGSLGFTRGSTPANDCCAIKRSADNAIVPEAWNGNAFVQLSGKTFAALTVVRAQTTTGQVQLERLAFLTGAASFTYPLVTGQVLQLNVDGGGLVSATFTGTVATHTGVVFPGGGGNSGFAGGETLTLGFDDPVASPNFVVTFLATDQSAAQVAAKINIFAGFTFATVVSGGLRFTGRLAGTSGQIRIVGGSSGVVAALGLTVANFAGAGNVGNITAVTFTEVQTIVQAAFSGTKVELDSQARLRISDTATPLTGTLLVGAATTATALGFAVGASANAATAIIGTIPAGTIVQNTGATSQYVLAQSITTTSGDTGIYTALVRPRVDDGTDAGANAGVITVVATPPDVGAFSCSNLTPIAPALTEAAIDAAYVTALASTLNPSAPSATANIIYSARQSNTIRRQLKVNAIGASSQGLYGRMAVVRTPLNTLESVALSTVSDPGVGAYRDRRVIYCYPQANTFVGLIATRGISGGFGFTASGNVDVGADGWLASVMSQLPPEQNPGQATNFTANINDLETGPNVQNFTINDYIAFKAAGICALRMDPDTGAIFQSGVTSVDPLVNAGLAPISRQRLADYLGDTITKASKKYGKTLMSKKARRAYLNEVKQFLDTLLSVNNPDAQRISGYTWKESSSVDQIAKGLARYILNVRQTPDFLAIAISMTVGTDVSVEVT